MAGSIALSLTQRYDKTSHLPLDGGILTFFAAGTSTPQNAYQDVSLTIPWPNPIILDSGGNVPQLFFADGYIKFRLANAEGVVQIAADYVLVIGPSDGVGAAPSVDATTLIATGDVKYRYGTGALAGYVRGNGRTIGSAASSATERANADCEDLFIHLYTEDANLAVSGGRGASAAADWAANKTIALPDFRGRLISALDDMGNTAAGRRTTTHTGVAATVLGSVSTHGESHTLTAAQLPSITSANASQNISVTVATPSSRQMPILLSGAETATWSFSGTGGNVSPAGNLNGQWSGITSLSGTTANNISVTSSGTSGNAHSVVDPTMFLTIYIKL